VVPRAIATADPAEANAALVDSFIDALWLEDGLAANTLAAYRRDLQALALWLGQQEGAPGLTQTRQSHLLAYALARHAGSRASSGNRRLAVFRRFFRWALREHHLMEDPTLQLSAARQALRVPKTLSEAQVAALLAAPDVATPLGLRDRCMLELMYASGLRVSELVDLASVNLGLGEGVVRVTGKGSKERRSQA
jgi:integrase/recombinase XerD